LPREFNAIFPQNKEGNAKYAYEEQQYGWKTEYSNQGKEQNSHGEEDFSLSFPKLLEIAQRISKIEEELVHIKSPNEEFDWFVDYSSRFYQEEEY